MIATLVILAQLVAPQAPDSPLIVPFYDRLVSEQGLFLQSGTGATLQTIETGLRRHKFVTDYGAVCDGTTDDSGAFATAFAASKRIYLPDNATCSLGTTGITPAQFGSLVGSGPESSILSVTPTGCAITLDSVEGVTLDGFRLNVLGSSATKRGICFANTTAANLRNTIRNVQVWGDPNNARVSGTYGIYVHSTTSFSLYYNEFDHVDANLWDTCFENLGDAGSGGANANKYIAPQCSASLVGWEAKTLASDNWLSMLHCNGGGASSFTNCAILGDGSTQNTGNHLLGVTVDNGGGSPNTVWIKASSKSNVLIVGNEGGTAVQNDNDPSSDTNVVIAAKAGSAPTIAAGNITIGNGAISGGTATGTDVAGTSITISAGNGAASNGNGGSLSILPGSKSGTGQNGSVTIGRAGTLAARSGIRNAAGRYIVTNKAGAPVDCAAANLSPTVSSILDFSIYTCATAQTLTLPTAQGATGIVQNLPGTPANGDIFEFIMSSTAANNFTLVAGTGGTIIGNAAVNNASKIWRCRLTAVTGGSETYSCY